MFNQTPENRKIVRNLENYICANSTEGETLLYDALNAVAGADVQNGKRYLLHKALALSEMRLKCNFRNTRGLGYERVPINETPEVGAQGIRRNRRLANKTMKKLQSVIGNNELIGDARTLISLQVARLGWIKDMANNRTIKESVKPASADPFAGKKAWK